MNNESLWEVMCVTEVPGMQELREEGHFFSKGKLVGGVFLDKRSKVSVTWRTLKQGSF